MSKDFDFSQVNRLGMVQCITPLSSIPEVEARWLVPGWIPEGQITLLAGDGGTGKTTLWCSLAAAVSAGTSFCLDPEGHSREKEIVLFLTTEDSVSKKLKKKLRLVGADMDFVWFPDPSLDDTGVLRATKFGSAELECLLRLTKPKLCIFDPIQGFVPPEVNMGSRNAMRDCLAPLVTLGEELGTTFLIVVHSNKRKGASGRDRVADSADIWDIARSVLMVGFTGEKGVHYLSNEKNNYTLLQETLLFSIDEGVHIKPEGRTWKRDRDFMHDTAFNSPKREDCKAWLLSRLNEAGGSMLVKTLDALAERSGFSVTALRRAKTELKAEGAVEFYQTGSNSDRQWRLRATGIVKVGEETG